MVPDEEDRVERFVGGLPDNIQGNVKDAIRIANNLLDQKLKGYARNAENKRKFDNNPRINRDPQPPPFKRQNVGGQHVARAWNRGNKAESKYGRKTGNNEATTSAYAIGGGANPDSNVVMDTSYAVELSDGRISETNIILRGCNEKGKVLFDDFESVGFGKGKVFLDDFEAVGNGKDKVDGDDAKDELISTKGDGDQNEGSSSSSNFH
ncbi:hypothetical protein Tco_1316811 [Tanacetum coccineum]